MRIQPNDIHNKSIIELARKFGTAVSITNGSQYYFLPYWIEASPDGYFLHQLDDIPNELKEHIKHIREGL